MADFSHFTAVTADMIGRYAEQGEEPSDEMLLEGFKSIKPRLLSSRDCDGIEAILSHRRGRPTKPTSSREALAERVMRSPRSDVSEAFREALAARIRRRKGLSEFERQCRTYRSMARRKRDMFICALYYDFYNLLDSKGSAVHPILGGRPVPRDVARTRSETALYMTHSVLEEWGMSPPTERRMLNIISQK